MSDEKIVKDKVKGKYIMIRALNINTNKKG